MSNLLTLPISERIQLVEYLWDSIAADQAALPLTDDQKKRLDERLKAFETDGNYGRPAAVVINEIKAICESCSSFPA